MPNTVNQVSFGFVDAKGFQSRYKFYISYDTTAHGASLIGDLNSVLLPLTNAANFSAPGLAGFLTTSGEYGTAAVYESVTDKAVFTAIDSAGQIHRLQVPAPKSAIFLADGITVDTSNTDVNSFVQVIINAADNAYFISTRGGLQFSSVPFGLRVKKRNQRRLTGFVKSGNLDEPAE